MTPAVLAVLLAAVNTADPDPRSLAVPAATTARAAALVANLAAPAFADREAAARELAALGRLARPALEAALASTDPEVAARCRALLPKARKLDADARLACLLTDTTGKYAHETGGWPVLAKATGDTPAARAFYAEMVKEAANAELLAALRNPTGFGPKFSARREDVLARMATRTIPPVTVADMAALLLAELAAPPPPNGRPVPFSSYRVLLDPAVRGVLTDEPTGPLRRLAARVLSTRSRPPDIFVAMETADVLGLSEVPTRTLAAAYLDGAKTETDRTPDRVARALGVLAKTGGKAELSRLRPYLTDPDEYTAYWRNGNVVWPANTTVGDFALAMSILLKGEDPKAYGFNHYFYTAGADHRPECYSFPNRRKRDFAFAKWAFREAFR